MNGTTVLMWRMMGSDVFNVWEKKFTRGFLRCDMIDFFDGGLKLLNEVWDRDRVWYERFREELKIGETLTIRIPQRLIDRVRILG